VVRGEFRGGPCDGMQLDDVSEDGNGVDPKPVIEQIVVLPNGSTDRAIYRHLAGTVWPAVYQFDGYRIGVLG